MTLRRIFNRIVAIGDSNGSANLEAIPPSKLRVRRTIVQTELVALFHDDLQAHDTVRHPTLDQQPKP